MKLTVDEQENQRLIASEVEAGPNAFRNATPDDLEKALLLIPEKAIDIKWVEQLALERIKKVSEILIQELGVANDRVFSNYNPVPGTATGITFELTD